MPMDAVLERSLLLADISGSTALYEAVGDEKGARCINACIDHMRETIVALGGVFIGAKGDDVLASFEDADAALTATETILDTVAATSLSVHVGLHFGRIVLSGDDILGDAVNVTARLAGAANAGEVLISQDFASRLGAARLAHLRPIPPMVFKGKSSPVKIYSLGQDTRLVQKETTSRHRKPPSDGTSAVFRFEERRAHLLETQSLSIGRAPENAFVIDRPWVSRLHATVAISGGRVQFRDHSSYGSYVTFGDAAEFVARRESVVLVGSGHLSLGLPARSSEAAVIRFEVSG